MTERNLILYVASYGDDVAGAASDFEAIKALPGTRK